MKNGAFGLGAFGLGVAAVLAYSAISNLSAAKAGSVDIEVAIQDVLPRPIRCGRTAEPLFYCRHDHAPEHSMVLDLTSTRDGPSASLTYDYDDARHRQLLAVMRRFFSAVGISADAFDECILQSQWQPVHVSTKSSRIACYRVELGDRVTYEAFATTPDGSATLARAAEVLDEFVE